MITRLLLLFALVHAICAQTFNVTTDDPCTTPAQCSGAPCLRPRPGDTYELCDSATDRGDCFCATVKPCETSTDCGSDAACANVDGAPFTLCVGCAVLDIVSSPPNGPVDSLHNCTTATPSVQASPSQSAANNTSSPPPTTSSSPATSSASPDGLLSLETCFLSKPNECAAPRRCSDLEQSLSSGAPVQCTANSETCSCFPPKLRACTSSSICQDGERCIELQRNGSAKLSVCASCTAVITKSPEISFVDDGANKCAAPCIAASALQHLSQEELVFPRHLRAAVLCDQHGNCATPGHVVLSRGAPMMMKNYCLSSGVRCTKSVAHVNSPKMKRQLRIPSKSEHLSFTAFAARYESMIEEKVISAIVRSGL